MPEDMGFEKMIQQETERRARRDKALENVPYTETTFSPEAVNKMILINKVIADIKKKPIHVEEALAEIQQYLSTYTWKYIFTTGEVDESHPDDSVYYVTEEGTSLRLKRAHIKKYGDINRVVEPFMEKIYFENNKNKISFEPEIGLEVEERLSTEFFKLQRGENMVEKPFKSNVRVYSLPPDRMPPDGGFTIGTLGEEYHHHHGHAVNSFLSQ